MVSFEVRLHISAISVLLLIALGVPRLSAAQPAPNAEDPLARIAGQIVEAQTRGGSYAKELIEPLQTLSLFYQEKGDYALELAALEQARQVVRANYGLSSLEQAPLMRRQIRAEEAGGDFTAAWELEQALLALAQKHPDDPRTAPIYREIGDKRMELMRSFLAGERPPQLILGCYYDARFDDQRNCTAGSREGAARRILVDAQRNYANAIGVLRRGQEYGDELLELENRLLLNSYLSGDYQQGRQGLVRMIYDDAATSQPALSRIDRLVQLADWDLRFGQRALALDLYAKVYEYLEKQGARATIQETFSPATPVVVPTFVPNLLASERATEATGYVDVEFDITQFGTARRIKVLDTTHSASKAAEQRISRWIVENRFRPRMAHGQLAAAARVVARHYVHE
jgi:tetratricopeptide (TPR) repeat protein